MFEKVRVYSLCKILFSAQHCFPSTRRQAIWAKPQRRHVHASRYSMVNKWDVQFGPTVTTHLGLKEEVCLPWCPPPPPSPQRPSYQNMMAGGGDPVAPVTSQSSRCILALVSLCLDLYSPCHDPPPHSYSPTPLNTHRGPINPIMQMGVINRIEFSLLFPLCLP